ncbi:hypothetical protein F0562_008411 [Nyssa sinensis]|uniref:Uncharacterized protein n=1 Tax=Nyssa sinensis TaxID=561372 RepID=A0A5J5A995_9ASTE|nr:hypothetical protein F0562_008411 [Nyssa sinensis]
MPSGPKKRRAAKKRQEKDANVNNETSSQDDVLFSSIPPAVEANISAIETLDVAGLAKPVVASSEGLSNIENLVNEDVVGLGLKENDLKLMPSSYDYIVESSHEIVLKSHENDEVFPSLKGNAGVDSTLMGSGSEENESRILQTPNSPGVETNTVKEQIIPACPLVSGPDISKSHEVLFSLNDNTQADSTLMGSRFEENQSKLLHSPDDPGVETGTGRDQIISACHAVCDRDLGESLVLSSLNESTGQDSILMDNLLQTTDAPSVETSTVTENVIDCKHESPEYQSFSEQTFTACPLNCSSYQLVGNKLKEKIAEDAGKNKSCVEQLERLKKLVEAELHVADNIGLLLRNFLDDLNAIQVPEVL